MEIGRSFKKVERSYHSTPNGWRLATFEEASNGLESIKEQQILSRWDRVRLLDGWISGPGYNYEIRDEFRGCMGHMLLIQTQTPAGNPYADVDLSELRKEVALLLCVDDWNYEVVYWLLNSWSESQTMNLTDVREGKVPLVDAGEFQKMNEAIARLARRLGDEEVAAREKAATTTYSGKDSVKEVLMGMIQIVKEVELIPLNMWLFRSGRDGYFIPESVQTGDVEEAFWSFVCETFAGHVVEIQADQFLDSIRRMKTKGTGDNNLTIANSILLYLSDYRSDIIHEPLPHRCLGNCGGKILEYAEQNTVGDPHTFSEMLKHNAMWRCYDEKGGRYGVLNKLLFIVAKGKYNNIEGGGKIAALVVDTLLKCGAQPAERCAIGNYRQKTALHNAAEFVDHDASTEIVNLLLRRCGESVYVNAADENGTTALHSASKQRNANLCQLLVDYCASVIVQDQDGMTPLHYALEGERIDKVINVFMNSSQVAEFVHLKDSRGYTPLDIAIANKDYESTAKLLSKLQKPEDYFSKVDQEQLLRYSLLRGYVGIFKKLYENEIKLPSGNYDEDRKSALHLAAMLDDEDNAIEIVDIILSRKREETPGEDKNIVAECDRRRRCVLHEAALNGYATLCKNLLEINPNLIYMKDRDRRNPLYDAAKGKNKSASLYILLLNAWEEKDKPAEDLIDRSGLTPLHVAVSEGNVKFVKKLLSSDRFKEKYLSRGDFLAQTALHMAAKRGNREIVEILLQNGAHLLRERDCDGRTALHYAAQAETGDKKELAVALLGHCKSEEEESLLLWASAAGLGTADQILSSNDPLCELLLAKKGEKEKQGKNLLRLAAAAGDIEMTKELIIRGYQSADIRDSVWTNSLHGKQKYNAEWVSEQIKMIKEVGNDKPAMLDKLGRLDYAQGLAALFLNPYIKPPIAVGITGTWGMGKSSLMLQTEQILLTTAAQMALLQTSKLPSSALKLPAITSFKLSSKGKRKCQNIYKQINYGQSINRNMNTEKIQEELKIFLSKYELKYRKVFKSLAAMDSSDMFDLETNAMRSKAEALAEEIVPAVLTVQYNAWKYRNDTEALAGMAVEITKELEGVMTQAQWLSTCCRNTWRKKKYSIWIEIFFPSLLALVLVSSLTWIAWVVFDNDKLKEWVKAKYAWPPAAMVIIGWTLTKSVMGILKPVSTQLMQYVSFPDHTNKLGYQEIVISDINFLKKEIGKNAFWPFVVFCWLSNTCTVVWRIITDLWLWSIPLSVHRRSHEKTIDAPKVLPASESNLRIIVFVDDLDRCHESVILQVLSAINIVLAECEINVVMGMDKNIIQRAIMKKYGDGKANRSLKTSQELADLYLQKIIQLPLDLPDPSEEQSTRFLKGQLGVIEKGNKMSVDRGDEESVDRGSNRGEGESEAEQQNAPPQVSIDVVTPSKISEKEPNEPADDRSLIRGDGEVNVQPALENNCLKFFISISKKGVDALRALLKADTERETTEPAQTGMKDPSHTDEGATGAQQNPSSSIVIREMLFVRYSQGEENAFLQFQRLATDCRKLPREWKRLLNYHRLVWYIFSLSKEAKNLPGWQVQLITWIFICWEWQENMNFVIENWKVVSDLKTSELNEPSLLQIVEHLMEENQRETPKMTDTGDEENGPKRNKKLVQAGGFGTKINNKEETESSNKEFNENGQGKILKIADTEGYIAQSTDDIETMEKVTSQKLVKDINKLDALEKSFAELKEEIKNLKDLVSDELKKEMKELIKQASDELKEDMKELKNQVSDELKKDINEIKEQMIKKQNGKNEQNMENRKKKLHNLENWKRMKSTLERYDVPMDGIQAFQRFRFYCVAGYLPRPSLRAVI